MVYIKLDKVAQLVADPPLDNSTPLQNNLLAKLQLNIQTTNPLTIVLDLG